MSEYLTLKKIKNTPRLPLEGSIDLTYRCNNNCRHCWLWVPQYSPERQKELTFDEIRGVVDNARKMGCRQWSISGGEPMQRPDFAEIFDYITSKSISYSLNTNGTFITPSIAQLLKRKGNKMVALYGATAEVHDHITRNPGSFEATMQGFAHLKEAGAGFTVQLIPMRDNYHQFNDMVSLAESLSRHYRVGAAWLYLSASGDPKRNQEIMRQRLDPKDVIELDKPDLSYEEEKGKENGHSYCHTREDNCLFVPCINGRREFHVDPYGKMTFCCFIKDPAMRYDLRGGSFKKGWEEFIPSLANKLNCDNEYSENCGSCELRGDCRCCPVYAFLEHRRFTAKVDYLCDAARENRKFKEDWKRDHRRFYQSGGITVQVDSDLPITDNTFDPKLTLFEVNGPGEETISIRHHFSIPDMNGRGYGKEVYRKPPWAIYRNGGSWVYAGISPIAEDNHIHQLVVFNDAHSRARIYNDKEETFRKGGLHSLTLFPTDQILFARVLANIEGCYLHSAGAIFEGKGLLFVGHSEAGKSTTTKMLMGKAEILCDDRIIVRRKTEGFRIYGTWSHGEVPEVSPNSAPLKAILFLEKDEKNELAIINDKREIIKRLLSTLIKPFVTADWWEKMLSLIALIAREVPCYSMRFDKSGKVVDLLQSL